MRPEGIILFDYLPYIVNKNNQSENLFDYLIGAGHYVFYLAREPFLGKDINEATINEVYNLISKYPNFDKVNPKPCNKEEELDVKNKYI